MSLLFLIQANKSVTKLGNVIQIREVNSVLVNTNKIKTKKCYSVLITSLSGSRSYSCGSGYIKEL